MILTLASLRGASIDTVRYFSGNVQHAFGNNEQFTTSVGDGYISNDATGCNRLIHTLTLNMQIMYSLM